MCLLYGEVAFSFTGSLIIYHTLLISLKNNVVQFVKETLISANQAGGANKLAIHVTVQGQLRWRCICVCFMLDVCTKRDTSTKSKQGGNTY